MVKNYDLHGKVISDMSRITIHSTERLEKAITALEHMPEQKKTA